MNCPVCGSVKHKVLQSRDTGSVYNSIKRRRECARCETRWTTREFISENVITKAQRELTNTYLK